MSKDSLIAIISLFANLPVWSIVFFLWSQSVKRRNDIEKRIGQTLDAQKKANSKQAERIAILETKLKIYERSNFNASS